MYINLAYFEKLVSMVKMKKNTEETMRTRQKKQKKAKISDSVNYKVVSF